MTIRVLVADDEPMLTESIGELIRATDGFELAGIAATVDDALAIEASTEVDVVISDNRMPGGGGVRLARELSRRDGAKVVGHSAYADDRTITDMLRAGAVGFVPKGGKATDLLEAVRRAAEGRSELIGPAADAALRTLRLSASTRALKPEEAELVQRAFSKPSLSVVFQPILDLTSRTVVGAEALARFALEPVRGPDQWFAAAERAGLLVEADITALRESLEAGKSLPKTAFLACNVTPQLTQSTDLQSVLEGSVGPNLVIEVTERAAIEDYAAFSRQLAPLRANGVRVAIDDAGAGFASLRHILRLDPDIIKLDRDLCRGINADPAKIALANALASFAFGIGAVIIAEGIETEAELDVLTALGVSMGQGYLLGKPVAMSATWPAA